MIVKFISICFIVINISFQAWAQTQDIVATVNDFPITEHDVKKRANLVIFSSGMNNDQNTYESIKPKIIDMLIDEKLIEQDSLKTEVSVEDSELKDAYESIPEKNNMSKSAFKALLISKKVEENELINQIKHQILWNKVVRIHLQPNVQVFDKEISDNRARIEIIANKQQQITEVKLAEILLSVMKTKDIEKQTKVANQLVKQLNSGAEFNKVAREFSDALTKNAGGLIGWIPLSQMMPELAHVIKKIKIGEISEPIILPDGVHIIKVLDQKIIPNDPKIFDDEEIKEILFNRKLSLAIRTYLRKLHNDSYINIKK